MGDELLKEILRRRMRELFEKKTWVETWGYHDHREHEFRLAEIEDLITALYGEDVLDELVWKNIDEAEAATHASAPNK